MYTTVNGATTTEYTFEYDEDGNMVEAQDILYNNAIRYTYDELGRMTARYTDYTADGTVEYTCTIEWTDADDGTSTSVETCGNGATTTTTHDARGLATQIVYVSGTYTTTQTNEWREDCQMQSYDLVTPSYTITGDYTYDADNRMTQFAYIENIYFLTTDFTYTCE